MQRALDLIGDTVAALDATASRASPAGATACKVGTLLRGLETYVAGQAALIIDYAAGCAAAEAKPRAPRSKPSHDAITSRAGSRSVAR